MRKGSLVRKMYGMIPMRKEDEIGIVTQVKAWPDDCPTKWTVYVVTLGGKGCHWRATDVRVINNEDH